MAANALEEKINKIRQQNEEIRRRHEEVEEDKKNAAKLNALVQMVPSTDWPERKEPPDFSIAPRTNSKPKSAKEHHEHVQQYHSVSGEGRKVHIFAQGQGPPPDPKYNFLADSEREESNAKTATKEGNNPQNRGQKHTKGHTFKRKSTGKDGMQRDYRTNKGSYRDEHQPEYEAWRAERNRIDEDRISRQRTAEGNWRREWDNDKAHIVDEVMRPEAKLGDYAKRDHKDFDRRYHVNGNDYANHNRSGNRSYRGNSRHFHNNYENRSNNSYHHQDGHGKSSASASSDERTVVATDKSLKVTLSQGNMMKGPVMSVKVNSPSIAGTGRVGPRQRSRVTYSSHSDVEVASPDSESFSRPKSYEDKTKGIYHDNLQISPNSRKLQPPRKKDFSNKSPYFRKKEMKRESANENSQKHHETETSQKESQELHYFKLERPEEDAAEPLKNDEIVTANEKESDANYSDALDVNNIEINEQNNQNLNLYTNKESEDYAIKEPTSQNSDLSESVKTEGEEIYKTSEEMENKLESQTEVVEAAAMSKCETVQLDLVDVKDDNDRSEIKSAENATFDAKDTKKTVAQNEEQSLSTERTEEIVSNNCDSKQSEDLNKQENDVKRDAKSSTGEEQVDEVVIPSSTAVYFAAEEDDKPESDDKASKEEEISAVEDETATAGEQIETSNKQDVIKCADEAQERTSNDDNEEKSSAEDNAVIGTIESPEKDLQMENEETALSKVIETVT